MLCRYAATTVMDGKTALRMLMAGKQQFDLVITDVRMPDMDGFKLLELIRLEMDLPVISTLTAQLKVFFSFILTCHELAIVFKSVLLLPRKKKRG